MTLLLKQLFALLRLLNSDTGTNQIAAGVACGLILGFAPMLSLQGLLVLLCTTLYNLPLLPLTRFYNSVVMGAGVISLLLAPLVFFGSKRLIVMYREQVVARFRSSPFWKLWSGTTFFKWYSTYEKFHG